MAFTYGFYDSLNGDRKYNTKQLSSLFDGIIKDGVFDSIGEIFATVPGEGLQVLVKTGKAWFDHTWNDNDSVLPLTVATPDATLPRFDAVILEVDSSDAARANSIKIKKGNPGYTPVKPEMTNTQYLHQHPLAYIRVNAAVTEIGLSDIEIVVGRSECPFVTSVLEGVNIEDLFGKWQGDFDTWFDNLKQQLTEDVVTNLQKQIDERVKISDKATQEEAEAGVSNSKWMTPTTTQQSISKIVPFYAEDAVQVGEIRTAMKNPNVDLYALANGAGFYPEMYPELSTVIPYVFSEAIPNFDPYKTFPESLFKSSRGSTKLCKVRNYYIVLGITSQKSIAYAYTQDFLTWQEIITTIPSGDNQGLYFDIFGVGNSNFGIVIEMSVPSGSSSGSSTSFKYYFNADGLASLNWVAKGYIPKSFPGNVINGYWNELSNTLVFWESTQYVNSPEYVVHSYSTAGEMALTLKGTSLGTSTGMPSYQPARIGTGHSLDGKFLYIPYMKYTDNFIAFIEINLATGAKRDYATNEATTAFGYLCTTCDQNKTWLSYRTSAGNLNISSFTRGSASTLGTWSIPEATTNFSEGYVAAAKIGNDYYISPGGGIIKVNVLSDNTIIEFNAKYGGDRYDAILESVNDMLMIGTISLSSPGGVSVFRRKQKKYLPKITAGKASGFIKVRKGTQNG